MNLVKIGAHAQNDIVLDNDTVSRFHAEVSIDGDRYEIIDRSSKNGTYVNKRRVIKSSFKNADHLRFGDYHIIAAELLVKIKAHVNEKRTDFTKEYTELFKTYHEYGLKKNKLTERSKKPVYLRLGLSLFVIIIIVGFPQLIPNDTMRYALIMGVGLVSVIPGLFAAPMSQKQEKLDILKLEYDNLLVCPKCGYSMLKHSLTIWKGKKSCLNDKCDAIHKLLTQ